MKLGALFTLARAEGIVLFTDRDKLWISAPPGARPVADELLRRRAAIVGLFWESLADLDPFSCGDCEPGPGGILRWNQLSVGGWWACDHCYRPPARAADAPWHLVAGGLDDRLLRDGRRLLLARLTEDAQSVGCAVAGQLHNIDRLDDEALVQDIRAVQGAIIAQRGRR